MVSPKGEGRRNEAEYSLDGIRRLAGFGQIELRGRRLRRHLAELDYQLDDVCHCLVCLQQHHFSHSERYEDDRRWHDVYKMRHTGRDGVTHDIYIKLRLDRDCIVIELCSFHPEGWL